MATHPLPTCPYCRLPGLVPDRIVTLALQLDVLVCLHCGQETDLHGVVPEPKPRVAAWSLK